MEDGNVRSVHGSEGRCKKSSGGHKKEQGEEGLWAIPIKQKTALQLYLAAERFDDELPFPFVWVREWVVNA